MGFKELICKIRGFHDLGRKGTKCEVCGKASFKNGETVRVTIFEKGELERIKTTPIISAVADVFIKQIELEGSPAAKLALSRAEYIALGKN